MRFIIFLIVLVFGLCYGQDSSSSSNGSGSSYGSDDGNGDQNADESSAEANNNDILDGSSNGEDDYYNTLCGNPVNKACVKKFFRTSAQCIVAPFGDSHPVYRQRHTSYVPSVNLTLITVRDVIKLSGSKIENFYLNRKTKNLVMTVSFESIRIESDLTYYFIDRRDQEPVIASDSVNVTYGTTTLTAIIPIIHYRIDMKRASVHAYQYDASPKYEIGPGIANSSNPVVAKTVDALLSNLPTSIQEVFLTEAKSFFLAYFQSQICIFGIPLQAQI